MTLYQILLLVLIGLFAGAMSGFIGIGGGVVMVPALVYIMGLSQHEAQGTSLILMLPPIGILAVMNYYKAGQLNINYGVIIALAFVIGGYYGSKLSLKLSPAKVKLIFGFLMLYIAVKMIYSGVKEQRIDNNELKTKISNQSITKND
ncbi:MAG TPA: sulfite exporter TauE/SafE family protein [Crocinitomix sp.]|nr:sulfite exporter TauE/SafE family protein [Crocinitomix sp.]